VRDEAVEKKTLTLRKQRHWSLGVNGMSSKCRPGLFCTSIPRISASVCRRPLILHMTSAASSQKSNDANIVVYGMSSERSDFSPAYKPWQKSRFFGTNPHKFFNSGVKHLANGRSLIQW